MIFSHLLPRTHSTILWLTVALMGTTFCAYAAYFSWARDYSPFSIAAASLLVVIAIFLWWLHRYACAATKCVIVLVCMMLCFGMLLNPFFALDYDEVYGHTLLGVRHLFVLQSLACWGSWWSFLIASRASLASVVLADTAFAAWCFACSTAQLHRHCFPFWLGHR